MHAHVEREVYSASSSGGVEPESRGYGGSPTAFQDVQETCRTRPQRVASRGDQLNVRMYMCMCQEWKEEPLVSRQRELRARNQVYTGVIIDVVYHSLLFFPCMPM